MKNKSRGPIGCFEIGITRDDCSFLQFMQNRSNTQELRVNGQGAVAEFDFDVFLSHNGNDKPLVRELKRLLVEHKLRVWLDEDELQPGLNWQPLLEAGVRSSKTIAVLIGPDGLGPWENEEMQAALQLAVRDKRPIIPTLLPECLKQPEVPLFLGNRTWVDLRGGYTDAAIGKLIWGIEGKWPDQPSRATIS